VKRSDRHELFSGDTLVFRDGVTETMNRTKQMFGTSRLRELLSGQPPLEYLQRIILDSVQAFSRASQAYDITLLLAPYRMALEASVS
jgi:serine phosphatase RsbU (regulator of sigma subunit)